MACLRRPCLVDRVRRGLGARHHPRQRQGLHIESRAAVGGSRRHSRRSRRRRWRHRGDLRAGRFVDAATRCGRPHDHSRHQRRAPARRHRAAVTTSCRCRSIRPSIRSPTRSRAQVKTTPADRLITGEFGESGMGESSLHPRVARRDRAQSRGHADGLHRSRHAAEQQGARTRGDRRVDAGSGRRRLRSRRARPVERPPRRIRAVSGQPPACAQDRCRRGRPDLSAVSPPRRSAWGITSTQLLGDSLPIAEASRRIVEANMPIRMKVFRFPMREAGGGNDGQPSAAAAAAVTARRGARHEVDSRRHADRAAGFHARAIPRRAGRAAAGSTCPQSRIDEFVGWAYGSGRSAGGPCRSAMARSMLT